LLGTNRISAAEAFRVLMHALNDHQGNTISANGGKCHPAPTIMQCVDVALQDEIDVNKDLFQDKVAAQQTKVLNVIVALRRAAEGVAMDE
jgi:hypothetical protein